jgi:hypothetical protein
MIQVSRDDVLKGLRRFKRLAKQDILVSPMTPDPTFWRIQAESRRKAYDELIELVENDGVIAAYQYALKQYDELRADIEKSDNPQTRGRGLAYELFLEAIGVSKDELPETPSDMPAGETVQLQA